MFIFHVLLVSQPQILTAAGDIGTMAQSRGEPGAPVTTGPYVLETRIPDGNVLMSGDTTAIFEHLQANDVTEAEVENCGPVWKDKVAKYISNEEEDCIYQVHDLTQRQNALSQEHQEKQGHCEEARRIFQQQEADLESRETLVAQLEARLREAKDALAEAQAQHHVNEEAQAAAKRQVWEQEQKLAEQTSILQVLRSDVSQQEDSLLQLEGGLFDLERDLRQLEITIQNTQTALERLVATGLHAQSPSCE